MIPDPAKWRAGRDGYGRIRRWKQWEIDAINVEAERLHQMLMSCVEPLPAAGPHLRHGRSGALYCGEG